MQRFEWARVLLMMKAACPRLPWNNIDTCLLKHIMYLSFYNLHCITSMIFSLGFA